MRRSRWLGLVALLGVIVLLDSEPAGGQFGRPGGGDRGPGGPPGSPGGFGGSPGGDRGSSGRGGFTMDPEMVWNQFYGGQGKDSINLNERPDIKSRLQQRGATIPPDGILTKAQFTADFQKRMAERAAGGGGFGGPPGGTPFGGAPGAPQVATITPPGAPGGFTPQPGGGPPSWGGRGSSGQREDDTIREFRRADRNNDGKVTPEEASNRLRDQFAARDLNRDGGIDQEEYRQYYIDAESTDKFREYDRDKDGRISFDEAGRSTKEYFTTIDTNKDNFIDPAEYKTYMAARLTGTLPPPPSASGVPTPYGGPTPPPTATAYAPQQPGGPWGGNSRQPPEEPRATSIRYGHLPKEVPGWFTELDSDKDGQIGLYEWKKDGRLMAEFVDMDLNGDGLLTAEEWMKSQRMKLDQQKLDELIASVGGPPAETTGSGRSSGGGGLGYRGPWGGAPSAGGNDKGGGTSDRSKGGDRGPGGPGGPSGFTGFGGMKGGDRPSMGGDRGPGGPGGPGGGFGGFTRGGRPGGDTKGGDSPRPEKAEKPEKGSGDETPREKGSKGGKDMRKISGKN